MPGFLGIYGGTEFVNVETGDHADSHDDMEWWAEIKRCLPQGDYDVAQDVLTGRLDLAGKAGSEDVDLRSTTDPTGYQHELVARSLVNWNLTDRDEVPLALQKVEDLMSEHERAAAAAVTKRSLAALPHPVFLRLYKRVNELNTPPEVAARAGFPGAAGGSDTNGHAGTSSARAVVA